MIERKKRIAFGCAGEGRGHAARTIALSELLVERYDITVFSPQTVSGFIKESVPSVEIRVIPEIGFYRENHRIRYRKTIRKNLPLIADFQSEINRIADIIRALGIDALVSDFEPLTAMAAAQNRIPVLNLNHPGVVLRYFSMKPDAVAAKIAAKLMMPETGHELICSFYGGDIGPILRKEIRQLEPAQKDYYLVYTKPESRQRMIETLENFPDEEFVVFPNSKTDFTKALAGCRGVISSAGHQMISEALYLKKPVLAFPQKMQFEQRLNTIMLERSGWGMQGDTSNIRNSIERFIVSIEDFPKRQTNNDIFLMHDYTTAAAECISSFVETAERTVKPKFPVGISIRKGRPELKPA